LTLEAHFSWQYFFEILMGSLILKSYVIFSFRGSSHF